MILKRDYTTSLTEELLNTSTGEIAIYLNTPSDSDMGYLLIEPLSEANRENIFFHRRSGNIVYAYGVNRTSPHNHITGAQVLFSNSIDYLNYVLGQVYDQTFIYKKSTNHFIVKWGNFYEDGHNIVIADLDTEQELENKTLFNGETNYIYLENGDYKISNAIITENAYLIATVVVSIGGIIDTIIKAKTYGLAAKWATGDVWIQGIPGVQGIQWPQWDRGLTGEQGNGITSITLFNTTGLVKTYKILFDDATFTFFAVEDGVDGENGTPGNIVQAPVWVTQIVSDNNVPPSTSTTTYSDAEKWIKTTYANGSYLLALATGNTNSFGLAAGLYNYTADNQALSSRTQAGTYDTISHSITWAIPAEAPVGTVAEVTTPDGVTTVQAGNIAYVNKPNVFTRSIVFQWDTAFMGRTAFPYNDMWNVSGTVTFDQKNGMQQKMTLTGNTILNFTNMTASAGIIEVVGNGTATFTLANPINNGSIIKTGIIGASYTNGTALTAYPHFFSVVCDQKVHVTYSWRSEDV